MKVMHCIRYSVSLEKNGEMGAGRRVVTNFCTQGRFKLVQFSVGIEKDSLKNNVSQDIEETKLNFSLVSREN